jgi:hypothetical protein
MHFQANQKVNDPDALKQCILHMAQATTETIQTTRTHTTTNMSNLNMD